MKFRSVLMGLALLTVGCANVSSSGGNGYEAFVARAEAANRRGDYPRALAAIDEAIQRAGDDVRPDLEAQRSLYFAARAFPVLAVETRVPGHIDGHLDLANLLRVDVDVNDRVTGAAIVDTGAEINVIRASLAEEAGLVFDDFPVVVGTVTDSVTGRAAYADRVRLGTMVFENVTFLVLPDDQLVFADGNYVVDTIIGLPLFSAAGAIGWSQGGLRFHIGEPAAPVPEDAPAIAWHPDGMALDVRFNDEQGWAFLDSGASNTLLRPGSLDRIPVEIRDRLASESRTRSGVGGATEVQVYRVPDVTLMIGGVPFERDSMVVDTELEDSVLTDVAAVGSDVIRQSRSFSIDFVNKRYAREPADG